MVRIIAISIVLMGCVLASGCAEPVHHETHETINIEKVESQEIVIE